MENWIAVCEEAELPIGTGLSVQIARPQKQPLAVALFRSRQGVYALHDHCPHRGGPLSRGEVDGRFVFCPNHGWKIDIPTGTAVEPARGCAAAFAVRVQRGQVLLNQAQLDAF
jgi:nitrite reductase (NADH) small subunit